MTYLKEFQESIQKNDYPRFLKLWEEYCYSDQPDSEELKEILQQTKHSELGKPFGTHVARCLNLWNALPDSPLKHDIIKLIFDIQNSNKPDLADTAYLYLQQRYPSDPLFEEKIRLIGLKTLDDFQGAISHYELLSHLAKGNFVFHTAGWGTGEINDLSHLREEVSCEFEYVIGIKTLSFSNAMKTLLPLSHDHFLARRFGNPDLLEKEAKENPAGVIKIFLRDFGPKTASDIKEEFSELIIPAEDWNRWWQVAKSKLKKDTQIETPSTASEPYRLLKEKISHEELLYKTLDTKPNVDQTIQIIYAFFKDFPQTLKNPEFTNNLQEKLLHLLTFPDLSYAQKLQILFLQQELVKEVDFSSLLAEIKNFQETIEQIESVALKKRLLLEIKHLRKDWIKIYLSLLFIINQNVLRDQIFLDLIEQNIPAELQKKIEELMLHPILYPHAFFWYFQKIIDAKESLLLSDMESKKKFFESFLILLDHLCQKDEARDLVKKMTNMLTANKYELVRHMFELSTIAEAKEYVLLSTKCRSLSPQDLKIIGALAAIAHPSLKTKLAEPHEGAKEAILWTTLDGYEKIQKRIKELATSETIKNAKEIEEARAHGDLRENAEFKAALEKRSRLQSELQRLTEEFSQARIITEDDVSEDKISVGSKVVCENSKKEKSSFILLGPWDADPEKNILSSQSKLAQLMLGHIVGDVFSFQGEEFKIVAISSYFD